MKMHAPSIRLIGSCALALWLSACTSSPSGGTGAAGTSGSAGTPTGGTTGTAGTGAPGTAGTTGTAGSGAAGTTGAAGAGPGTAGTTGTAGVGPGTAGTTGTAGAGPGTVGTTGAGGSGTAGTTGAGGTGVVVRSTGCGMAPRTSDSASTFVKKDVAVTGVDPAFISKYPLNAGTTYTWTKRNYFVRIPKGYDPAKAYPVDMAGTGCSGGETTGSGGEYTLPPGTNGVSPAAGGQAEAIQIGLSYAVSSAANPNCIAFTDDYVNSPEVQYIAAVVDDIAANYCVSKNQIFINGYSSGAFESVMAGCADADKIRGYGIQIGGGLRIKHPPCVNHPIASMFVVGTADTGNPIGPLATAQNDTFGSVMARDEVLHRNGCVAADFQIVDTCPVKGGACTAGVVTGDTFGNAPHAMWNAKYPNCQMYTGCPAKYPVVWCPLDVNHGNGPHPMGGDGAILEMYRLQGMWDFFMSLPEP